MEITALASKYVAVPDVSAAGEARRVATRLAEQFGFSETVRGELAVVVTEAARNAALYAGGGHVLLRPWRTSSDISGIDLLVIDSGPGIADVTTSMRDGFSTAGTPGTGMGAMKRMSASFDFYTAAQKGTILHMTFRSDGNHHRHTDPVPKLGVISVPIQGESVCGDGWAFVRDGKRSAIMVVDGLGHGAGAHEAANEAVEVFRKSAWVGYSRLFQRFHDALRKTRGAAIAVAELDPVANTIKYSGVGNIQGVVVNDTGVVQRLVSHTGTVGFVMSRTQEFNYPWPKSAFLVMHSDGIDTRWELSRYRGITAKHPAIAAGAIFRDHRRTRDDATVLVYTEH